MSPRPRSGPRRLSIRSTRSDGMSRPFGVSITASAEAPEAAAGVSSTTSSAAASAATAPVARRYAWVHGVQRGMRPSFRRFAWHLLEQNRKIVPSFLMNILPVPGSMSFPQKEQERRTGMGSPHGQLPGLARGLAEHEDVADLDGALRVPGDDPTLVPPVEDADLPLGGLACHARPADDLDDLGRDALVVRHRRILTSSGSGASPRGRR